MTPQEPVGNDFTDPAANEAPMPQPANNPVPPIPNQPMPEQPQPNSEMESNEEGGKSGIQQLAGQLSQMIRDYNAEQPQPDVETNKFAAGMVIAAAIKDLDEKDRKDIIKKLKAGDFDDVQEGEDGEPQTEPMPENLG